MMTAPSDPVVHVIDDDEAVRQSVTFFLKAAGMNVQIYDSATSFLRRLPHIGSGCVITDVRMPEISGIDLLRRLKDAQVQIPVIVITGHGDVPLAVQAMKSGATEFLEKPLDNDALLMAVKTALSTEHAVTQRQAERAEIADRIATLTSRERQVLDGLVAGHPNKTIAFDHGISPRTVEVYRAHLMAKMQARTLSDLVRMALVAGILP